jgi:hypothetical protein
MEEVMSSFEMVVGAGAAKSYTALALKAMSRHFGSLRDAIVSHIYAEKRKLMQDVPKVSSGLAQLSLFDRECRQKRMSLQQLGILHSQRQAAWRPIRGLPETSVAILRTGFSNTSSPVSHQSKSNYPLPFLCGWFKLAQL